MYNFVKNAIYSGFKERHAKNFYYRVLDDEKETVYKNGETLFVIVLNEETGKRLYNVLLYLKKHKIWWRTPNKNFYKVKDFTYDKNKVVKWFALSDVIMNWHWISSNNHKIIEFASIVNTFEENGLVLNPETFDVFNCNCISEIFSYFIPISEDEQEAEAQKMASKACLIEYAHYMLSLNGDTLSEVYGEIEKRGQIILRDVDICAYIGNYNVTLFKICYEYYKFHKIPDNLYSILKFGSLSPSMDMSVAYALTTDFASRYNNCVLEKTTEYTSYADGDKIIKIYNNSTDSKLKDTEYDTMMKIGIDFIFKHNQICAEGLQCLLFNLDKEFIGSVIRKNPGNEILNISNVDFDSQAEIFEFLKGISDFIEDYQLSYNSSVLSKEIITTNMINDDERNKVYDLSKFIVYELVSDQLTGDKSRKFMLKGIKEMFEILYLDRKKTILKTFFVYLLKLITKKYGELKTEKEVFEKIEVRALKPLVAKAFIQYALKHEDKKAIFYDLTEKITVIDAFDVMLHTYLTHMSSNNNSFCYDAKFGYDPTKVTITFNTEVEERYGLKLEKGIKKTLPDGRQLVIFGKARDINAIREREQRVQEQISVQFEKNGLLEDEHIKIVSFSEMIYSRKLNKNGTYSFIGYIREPIKGQKLTDKYLSTLSNKDLYKIAGYLYSKIKEYYIPNDFIYVDSDFNFYIDILQNNFAVKERNVFQTDNYPRAELKRLCKKFGWHKDIFVELEDIIASICWDGTESKQLKTQFLRTAESLDTYCDEHKMYYNSSNNLCPICAKTRYLVKPEEIVNKLKVQFEDKYAKHYKLNNEFYLKLYKPLEAKLFKIFEENVAEAVNTSNPDWFGQDCFIPCKKAVDSDNKFIGYVYKAVEFNSGTDSNEFCINFEDQEHLTLLPRLKSLKRLILQVQELINNYEGFMYNPYTSVFLNPGHKKQVQILNIEFLQKGLPTSLVNQNAKWLCEYVCKILNLDESVSPDEFCTKIIRRYCNSNQKKAGDMCYVDLKALLAYITKMTEELTKYCSFHKTYYSNKLLFCPKCMPNEALQHQLIVRGKKETFLSRTPENEGGESFIYAYKDGLIAKVFKSEQINLALKENTLCRILLKRDLLTDINKIAKKFYYVTPNKVLVDNDDGKIFGYIMEELQDVKPISNLKHKTVVEELGFTRQDVLEILITMGEGIQTMHEKADIYIGDLNGQNILFDKNKNVYFIDFDGMGVENIAPEFCTDGYIDPVSKENQNITMKDDWYSYAVQVFYYLTYTHPFNGIYYETDSSGKKVMLDIPDKMKKRVSLLGDHGLKPPAVAESWDWMISELKDAFLSIFEGSLRKSIVPLLKKQYRTLFSNDTQAEDETEASNSAVETDADNTSTFDNTAEEVIRINPKFIAKKLHPFHKRTNQSKIDVLHVFNEYSAICRDENDKFVTVIHKEISSNNQFDENYNANESDTVYQTNIVLSDDEIVKDVKLTEDGAYAFIIYADRIEVISFDSTRVKSFQQIPGVPDESKIAVDGNSIYYTRTYNNEPVIVKQTIFNFPDNSEIDNDIIAIGDKPVDWFNVKLGSKFVLVRRAGNGVDEVYCNKEKLCDITYSRNNSEYKIIYDKATKLWLVINTEGNGIIIESNGAFRQIDLQKYSYEDNMLGICFEKGKIYIPGTVLQIIDVFDESKAKQLQCGDLVTQSSQIIDVNKQGFCVKTGNTLYEICRG